MWKIKQPYNLNVAADAAARASLADWSALQERVRLLVAERERLLAALAEAPYLEPYPSYSNFLLCRVLGRDAQRLRQQLAERYGILVRYFDQPGLANCLRISVGKPEHTDALLAALGEIA